MPGIEEVNNIVIMIYYVYCLVNNIPGIEEVNMIKDDGTVIHFNNPKVRFHISSYFNC